MGTTARIHFADKSVVEVAADGYPDYVGPVLHAWLDARNNGMVPYTVTEADNFVDWAEAQRKLEYPKVFVFNGKETTVEYRPQFFSRDKLGHRLPNSPDALFNHEYTVTVTGEVYAGVKL